MLPNLEQAKVDLRPWKRLVNLDAASLDRVAVLERDPGHTGPVLAIIDDAHGPERRVHLENCEVGVLDARVPATDLDDDSLPLVPVEPVQRSLNVTSVIPASVGARPDGSAKGCSDAPRSPPARTWSSSTPCRVPLPVWLYQAL